MQPRGVESGVKNRVNRVTKEGLTGMDLEQQLDRDEGRVLLVEDTGAQSPEVG